MDDKLTLAATIWCRLEHHLTATGMSDDRTLEIERARCIAIIAEELGAKPVKAGVPKRAKAKAEPIEPVIEKLPLIAFPPSPPSQKAHDTRGSVARRGPSANLEAAMTKRLDQIIDASINRKVGYSGDDPVDYDRR